MDESLALNETCLDTKFIFVGTMVIEVNRSGDSTRKVGGGSNPRICRRRRGRRG